MKRMLFLAVVLTALIGTGVAPGAATARHRDAGASDRIVWSHATDLSRQTRQILSALPGGGELRALTNPAPGVQDIDPAPSPDGRRIAFERDAPDGGTAIALVNVDGSGELVLDLGCLDPCAADLVPTWTPDGRHIVFTRVIGPFDGPNGAPREGALWEAHADGSGVHRLTAGSALYNDLHASFSPDGEIVTFVRVRNEDNRIAVFLMRRRGGHARQLTPWELDADEQAFSPAQRGPTRGLIVFVTNTHGVNPPIGIGDIATVPSDCRTLAACAAATRYLTGNGAAGGPTTESHPGWSPDGTRIVFAEWQFDPITFQNLTTADVWTMDAGGGDRQRVSTSPLWDSQPAWGPAPRRG